MATKNPPEQSQKLNEELIHLRDRERILLNKLDRSSEKLASIYSAPLVFALARLYHRFIKRDERNA